MKGQEKAPVHRVVGRPPNWHDRVVAKAKISFGSGTATFDVEDIVSVIHEAIDLTWDSAIATCEETERGLRQRELFLTGLTGKDSTSGESMVKGIEIARSQLVGLRGVETLWRNLFRDAQASKRKTGPERVSRSKRKKKR